MADKPIESMEWATDALALKTVPSSNQQDFGWSTDDNSIGGAPVRPNLHNQNGWQNAAYKWQQFLESQGDENLEAEGERAVRNWSEQLAVTTGGWKAVVYAPELSLWVSVSQSGSPRGMKSPDGKWWEDAGISAGVVWEDIAWSPELGLFAAVGSNAAHGVSTSDDGITWSTIVPTFSNWHGICWSPERSEFVAVAQSSSSGARPNIMTSPDGVVWSTSLFAGQIGLTKICWSPELSLYCASLETNFDDTLNRIATSPDAITWTTRPLEVAGTCGQIIWAAELGLFVVTKANGIETSPDGINWTEAFSKSGTTFGSVAWSPEYGQLVAGTTSTAFDQSQIYSSKDGVNWLPRLHPSGQDARSHNYFSWSAKLRMFVCVGSAGANRVTTSL